MVESAVTEAPREAVENAPRRDGVRAGRRPVSPAAHLADRFAASEVSGPRAVSLREVPFLTMVGVRVDLGSAAAGRIEARLGLTLPSSYGTVGVGQVETGEGLSALWLSPDEFLVITEERSPSVLTSGLVAALAGEPGSATDLSANRTTFELAGPSARAVLEKGCALDLHPRAFAVGTASVTLIGSVPVIVWKIADATYRILPRSSFADFLGRWLIDAMTEFQAAESREMPTAQSSGRP